MDKNIKHGKRVKAEKKIRFYFTKNCYVYSIEIRGMNLRDAKIFLDNLGIEPSHISRTIETTIAKE